MIVERCICLLLSVTMLVESRGAMSPSIKNDDVPEVISTPVVEQIIDKPTSVVEEQTVIIEEPELPLTDEEIDLVALVTMAEAEGEPEEGKRLVIDVILNRLDSDKFPDTIKGVIYAKNAFECMWNGRVDRCYVREDIRQMVIDELNSRTNYDVLYFRTNRYHGFGTPVVSVGNHYFSTN